MNPVRSVLRREAGGALLAVLMVTMVIVAFVVMYERLTAQSMAGAVHRNGQELSLHCAQTFTDEIKTALRSQATDNASWVPGLKPGGPRVALSRTNEPCGLGGPVTAIVKRDANDASLYNILVTAYYPMHGGVAIIPGTTKTAARTTLETRIHTWSVGEFFAAVPTTLQIDFGQDLQNASVYARNLVFLPPKAGSSGLPQTKVKDVYYFGTLQATPDPAPGGGTKGTVYFMNPPHSLKYEPNMAILDGNADSNYRQWAGGDVIVPPGPSRTASLTTITAPGNSYGVYYVQGNLRLGAGGGKMTVSDRVIYYVTGNVYIGDSIQHTGDGWVAILAMGDIELFGNMPADAIVEGTFVTSGSFYAGAGSGNTLIFNGSFQAQQGVNLTANWTTSRTYSYVPPPGALPGRGVMLLPYLTTVDEYRILQGKFSQ